MRKPHEATDIVVEVVGFRDPDNDVDIEVFINGARVKAFANMTIVDPGRGYPYPLSEWRARQAEIGWSAGSAEWKRMVIDWYLACEDAYTTNDLTPATDPQPGVWEVDLLDAPTWVGRGNLADATGGPELAADNTIRAGWALLALQAFHHRLENGQLMNGLRDPRRLVPKTIRHYEAAEDAVAAMAQLTAPNAGPAHLPTLVEDLIGNLHHLADAKGISLAMPPAQDQAPDALHTLMTGLITHLRVAAPAWAAELRTDPSGPHDPGTLPDFPQLLKRAYRRYQDEVTGTL